jgi:hypothetical protein
MTSTSSNAANTQIIRFQLVSHRRRALAPLRQSAAEFPRRPIAIRATLARAVHAAPRLEHSMEQKGCELTATGSRDEG